MAIANRLITAKEIFQLPIRHGAGTKRVWVANPRPQSVTVYHPDGTSRTLRGDDLLSGEDVFTGFAVRVRDLFR